MLQKTAVEKIKTHILHSITVFRRLCRLWDNVDKYCRARRPQMNIRCMCIACWVPKTINTPSEYVIHIAFSLQQWKEDRACVLCYTSFVCLSVIHEIHPTQRRRMNLELESALILKILLHKLSFPTSIWSRKISPFNMPWIKTEDIVVKLHHFFNLGATWGCMGNATLRSSYPQERNTLPTVQEAGWFSLPVWTGVEKRKFLPPQRFKPLTVCVYCFAIPSKP